MKTLLPSFLALVFGLQADGAILLTYNFATGTTDTVGSAYVASNTVSPTTNYTVTNFAAGPGLAGNVPGSDPGFAIAGSSTTGSSNTRHMFVRVGGTDGANQADAVAANDYFSFTISPSAGFALNLSSLAFDFVRGTSTAEVFVRTSLDSFGTTIFSDSSSATSTTLAPVTPVALGASYQNITAPFEVRIYFADDTTSTDNNSIVNSRLDNIVLNGDIVAIPEPTGLLMLGIAGLPFVARRRRSVTLR